MSSSSSAAKPGYVPPLFSKFGKNVKDLFKRRYDFEHSLKTVNRSSRGFATESGAVLSESGALRGYVKGSYDDQRGTLEAELNTDISHESKFNFRLKNLPNGLAVNLLTSSKDKDKSFKRSVAGTEIEYAQENVSTALAAKTDAQVHKVDAQLALGYNGFAVGGQATADVSSGPVLQELNYGAEYTQDDFAVSLWTEKNSSYVNGGYLQKVSRNHVLGAIFKYQLDGALNRSLQLGSEYRLDANTIVKGKIDLPTGDVATNIEHRLADPQAILSLSAQFNAKANRFNADKLGLGITLGDFK